MRRSLQTSSKAPLIIGTLHSAACLKALQKDSRVFEQQRGNQPTSENREASTNLRSASRIFPADLLEVRLDSLPATLLDFFENSTSGANCGVASVLASSSMNYTLSRCAPEAPGTSSPEASFERSLLPKTWPLPVIATARHPAEGGQGNLTITARRRLLEEALPWAAAIDVELRSAKQLASTIARAHQAGTLVICSFHDFKTVPSLARLEESVLRAEDLGADLFKVAGMLHGMEELLRLVTFQSGTRSSLPIASMGMGRGGKLSRVLLAAYGSALSYGWLYKPQVSGQWSASELHSIFQKHSL